MSLNFLFTIELYVKLNYIECKKRRVTSGLVNKCKNGE